MPWSKRISRRPSPANLRELQERAHLPRKPRGPIEPRFTRPLARCLGDAGKSGPDQVSAAAELSGRRRRRGGGARACALEVLALWIPARAQSRGVFLCPVALSCQSRVPPLAAGRSSGPVGTQPAGLLILNLSGARLFHCPALRGQVVVHLPCRSTVNFHSER